MENRHRTYQRQSMGLVFFLFVLVLLTLLGRLFYLMIGKADYYGVQAKELHERERKIKAERGEIKDCHGNVLAANRSVSTISVIHSQMKEPERVITLLSKELMLDEKEVRKKVEKVKKSNRTWIRKLRIGYEITNWRVLPSMRTIKESTAMTRWHQRCLVLPAVIIRELSVWKYLMKNI